MSVSQAIQTARPVSASSFRLHRIAGFAGLTFAIVVGLVNVMVGAMSPPRFDASASEITAFVTDNTTALGFAVAVVPVGVVALFLFLASSLPLLGKPSSEAAFWARFGAVGLVLVEVMFLFRTLFEIALIARIESLAGEPGLVETLWQLQSAAMIITGLGLAVVLLGLSRAARLGGLIPGWHQALGVGASLMLFASAMSVVSSLGGSPAGLLGLVGFVGWLVWLALTSIRLLRMDPETVR